MVGMPRLSCLLRGAEPCIIMFIMLTVFLFKKFPAGNNSKRLWETFHTKVPRETFYTTSDPFVGGLSVVSLWSLSRLSVVSLSVLSVLFLLILRSLTFYIVFIH